MNKKQCLENYRQTKIDGWKEMRYIVDSKWMLNEKLRLTEKSPQGEACDTVSRIKISIILARRMYLYLACQLLDHDWLSSMCVILTCVNLT